MYQKYLHTTSTKEIPSMHIPPPGPGHITRTVSQLGLFSILLGFSGTTHADIYRFVTVDGVETFTDAPVDKQARVVIREPAKKAPARGKGRKAPAPRGPSLDEIAEKTVQTSLGAPGSPNGPIVQRLTALGGSVTSGVGMRVDPIDGTWRHHNGIDIAIPEGTPVTPAGAGLVVYSGHRPGYGNTVVIEHENRMVTLYGHNSRLMVAAGQAVDADTVIALSGNTGRSTGPHLHFEAWQAGTNITHAFMPGSTQPPPAVKLAATRQKPHFRKEVLSDGTILFTNLPPSSVP
jgi:murein DD-endopeptidase MepM/ murein hydrolase activator NlpD